MEKIVALIGGLNSLCYAARYLEKYYLEILIFNYGQISQVGLVKMEKIFNELSQKYPLRCRILNMDFLAILLPHYAQTDQYIFSQGNYDPKVVMPLRNTIFLAIATAFAFDIRARRILVGAINDDNPNSQMSLFPENLREYLKRLELIFGEGYFPWERPAPEIWSPIREGISQKSNILRGYEILGDQMFNVWNCYQNNELHCGKCYGCISRKKILRSTEIEDKTEYKG